MVSLPLTALPEYPGKGDFIRADSAVEEGKIHAGSVLYREKDKQQTSPFYIVKLKNDIAQSKMYLIREAKKSKSANEEKR